MVQGKIFLGAASPKTLEQDKVVKVDITLADTTGSVTIRKWESVPNDITDKCSYKLTHNHLKKLWDKSS